MPATTVLMHGRGLVQHAVHDVARVGAGRAGTTLTPKTLQHGARVEVGEAVLDDPVHREQQSHLEQRRQAAGRRADAALLVELPGWPAGWPCDRPCSGVCSSLVSSRSSGASICIRFCDTIWRAERRIVTSLINSVISTMATTMLPVRTYRPASSRKSTLEDRREGPGQERHRVGARREAGRSGLGSGVGLGAGRGDRGRVPVPGDGGGGGGRRMWGSDRRRGRAAGHHGEGQRGRGTARERPSAMPARALVEGFRPRESC